MRAGRCCAVGGATVPAALIALLPKCPACLAAYVALSGVGIPVTAAAWLPTAAAVVSVVSLFALASASGLRDRLRPRHKRALVGAGAVNRRHERVDLP